MATPWATVCLWNPSHCTFLHTPSPGLSVATWKQHRSGAKSRSSMTYKMHFSQSIFMIFFGFIAQYKVKESFFLCSFVFRWALVEANGSTRSTDLSERRRPHPVRASILSGYCITAVVLLSLSPSELSENAACSSPNLRFYRICWFQKHPPLLSEVDSWNNAGQKDTSPSLGQDGGGGHLYREDLLLTLYFIVVSPDSAEVCGGRDLCKRVF